MDIALSLLTPKQRRLLMLAEADGTGKFRMARGVGKKHDYRTGHKLRLFNLVKSELDGTTALTARGLEVREQLQKREGIV